MDISFHSSWITAGETAKLVSPVVCDAYIPPSNIFQSYAGSTPSPGPIMVSLNVSHSCGYVVVSHCGFNIHLPVDCDVEHLFVYIGPMCTSL